MEEEREENALKRLIQNGTPFKSATISTLGNDPTKCNLRLITEGGAIFVLVKQDRKDRTTGIREFKSINAAFNTLKKVGFIGEINLKIEKNSLF